MSTSRPAAVQQILACLQREHCHSSGGCRYRRTCTGGGPEALGLTGELIAYINYLERGEMGRPKRVTLQPQRTAVKRNGRALERSS